MGFETRLVVTEHAAMNWRLVRPLVYRGNRERFVVPVGFVTDFSSVPRLLWPALPPYGAKVTKAAVLHDYLYHAQTVVSRGDADGILRRVLHEEGSPAWRRWTMWTGVRLGGWLPWGRRARERSRERRI